MAPLGMLAATAGGLEAVLAVACRELVAERPDGWFFGAYVGGGLVAEALCWLLAPLARSRGWRWREPVIYADERRAHYVMCVGAGLSTSFIMLDAGLSPVSALGVMVMLLEVSAITCHTLPFFEEQAFDYWVCEQYQQRRMLRRLAEERALRGLPGDKRRGVKP